tara:strand:- start:7145 stop:7483 length:339 start_codon:yes stop_codon:yes gene_type:complete
MSSEIIVAILSSLTTACAVFLKVYLERKKESKMSEDIKDIIKSHNIKSIQINIQENNGDFKFKSEGSSLFESFIPLGDAAIQIKSSEKLSIENEKLITRYMENKINIINHHG